MIETVEAVRQKLTEAFQTPYPDIVEMSDGSRPDRRELRLASWVRAYGNELLDEVERLQKALDEDRVLDQHIERANTFAWNALQAIVTRVLIDAPSKTLS